MKKTKKIDRVAAELRRIAKENGGLLMPETVVSEARSPRSPLHPRFEWDDQKASEAYRLWQARQLIRVCVEQIPGTSAPTEVFVSLTRDRYSEGGYRITTSVLSSAQLREELLQDALDELEIFRVKYRRLKELAVVFSAIKRVCRK